MPAFAISNTNTLTVSQATHGFATPALFVQAYDNATPRRQVAGLLSIHPTSYAVTFQTLQTMTGTLLIAAQLKTAVSVPFASTLSVTVANTTHGFATPNLFVQVFDTAGALVDAAIDVHPTSLAVTATFRQAMAGRVVIASAEQSGAPSNVSIPLSGTTSTTIPAATHGLGSASLLVQVMDAATPAQQIQASVTVNPATAVVTLAFLQPQSGTVVVGGGASANTLSADSGVLTLAGTANTFLHTVPMASAGIALTAVPASLNVSLASTPYSAVLAGTAVALRHSNFVAGRENFTNQQTVHIPGTEHGYGVPNLLVQAYSAGTVAARLNAVITVDQSLYDVTVQFLQAQSGYVLVSPALDVTFSQAFTGLQTWVVSGATHGFPTPNLLVQVYDSTGQSIEAPITVDQATRQVTVTFERATSGRVVIANASAIGTPTNPAVTFTSQTVWSFPAATHGLGTPQLLVQTYDSAGVEVQGIVTVDPSSANVTVAFLQPQSGRLVVGGGSASQSMTADGGNATLISAAIALRTMLPLTAGSALTTGVSMIPRLSIPIPLASLSLAAAAATLRTTVGITPGPSVLAGTATALLYGLARRMSADAGAASLAGTATTLRHVARLGAASGSLSGVGTAVAFAYVHTMLATPGATTWSGTAVTLHTLVPLAVSSTSLVGTNTLLTFGQSRGVVADPASGSLSGAVATLRHVIRMPATLGSSVLSGTTVALARNRLVRADPGPSFATGLTAPLRLTIGLTAGATSLAGQQATLRYGQQILIHIDPGAASLVGSTVILRHTARMTATPGILVLLGSAVGLPRQRRVTATPQAMTVLGTATTLIYHHIIAMPAAPTAMALQGSAVAFRTLRALVVQGITLGLAGTPSSLRLAVQAGPGSGLGVGAPTALRVAVASGSGTLGMAGTDAALLYGSQRSLVAGVGPLSLGPAFATLRHLVSVPTETGAAVLSGAAIQGHVHIPVSTQSLILTGTPLPLRISLAGGIGTRVLAGTATPLRHVARMSATGASSSVVGQQVGLRYGLRNTLMASAYNLTLTGTAVLRRVAICQTVAAGISLTGVPVAMLLRVPAASGPLMLGMPPPLFQIQIPVAVKVLALTSPPILLPILLPAETIPVVSSAPEVALRYAQQLTFLAEAGTIQATGTPAVLRRTMQFFTQASSTTLAGQSASFHLRFPTAVASMLLAGTPITYRGEWLIIATEEALTLVGGAMGASLVMPVSAGTVNVLGTPSQFRRLLGGLVPDTQVLSLGLHRDTSPGAAPSLGRQGRVVHR